MNLYDGGTLPMWARAGPGEQGRRWMSTALGVTGRQEEVGRETERRSTMRETRRLWLCESLSSSWRLVQMVKGRRVSGFAAPRACLGRRAASAEGEGLVLAPQIESTRKGWTVFWGNAQENVTVAQDGISHQLEVWCSFTQSMTKHLVRTHW